VRLARVGAALAPYLSIAAILAAWELVAAAKLVDTFFLPRVSSILAQMLEMTLDGSLIQHAAISLLRALAGFALAAVVGTAIGLGMARTRAIHWTFDLAISVGNPAPKIALLPAFILWFGIGHESKILMVALSCVFPIVLSTYVGALGVNRLLVWSALSMGTSEAAMFRKVVLPHTLPFIFTGFQIALPIALIVVFVTEMVAGGGGLGFLLIYSARFFEIPREFAALFTVLVLGFALDRLLLLTRRRTLGWHEG
jgi:NitT/TauT family transport system permease protein